MGRLQHLLDLFLLVISFYIIFYSVFFVFKETQCSEVDDIIKAKEDIDSVLISTNEKLNKEKIYLSKESNKFDEEILKINNMIRNYNSCQNIDRCKYEKKDKI